MRVLLAPEGSRGDVQPMLVLADALRQAGHAPVVCGPPECADLAANGVRYVPTGQSIRERLDAMAETIAHGGSLAILREGRHLMRESITRQFEELLPLAARADFAIGAGLQAALPSVAEHFGLPYRYLVYCPGLLPSAEHPGAGIGHQQLPRWLNRASWRVAPRLLEVAVRRPLLAERRRLGLPDPARLYDHVLTFEPWVAADPLLAPVPGDTDRRHRELGFLFRAEGPPLPAKLLAFLDAGPPPVFVGFGSMPDPEPAATTRLVLEAAERAGCRLVVSAGWAGLGEGPLPEGVMAIDGVCHHRLFRRTAAVVHHGGAGTTSTAARAGVPQVIVPFGVDQPYWAHRAWLAGVSPGSLARRRLDPARLADLITACLETEMLGDRARELGERLRGAEPERRACWRRLLDGPARARRAAPAPVQRPRRGP